MLTPKQDAFSMAWVENGGDASKAYKTAGYAMTNPKTISEAASRLLKNSKVIARIKELQASHAERHQITVDTLVDDLEDDRQLARKLPNPQMSAAISATMGKAKLLGFLEDKTETNVTNNTLVIMDDNNRLEIARRLAFVLARGVKLAGK